MGEMDWIILDKELKGEVCEVNRKSDWIMSVKVQFGGNIIMVICGCAPQSGCEEEVKDAFWRELDQVIMEIPDGERVIVGADLNGHVGRR